MHPEAPVGAPRRRGAALDDALLDAAWQELVERGYGALTFDSVAQRAATSRPVIARRWATKPDLVRAAVGHELLRQVIAIPDTGSLREDTLALLRFGLSRYRSYTAFGTADVLATAKVRYRESDTIGLVPARAFSTVVRRRASVGCAVMTSRSSAPASISRSSEAVVPRSAGCRTAARSEPARGACPGTGG